MRPLIYLVLIGVMATLIWLDESPSSDSDRPLPVTTQAPPASSLLRSHAVTAMTSRDDRLFLGDESGRIWVLGRDPKTPQTHWFAHLGPIRQMHWLGKMLVTVSADGTVAEWGADGIPEKRSRLNGHHLNAAALLPKGGLVVAADRGTVARLDVGRRWRSPGIHAQSAFAIAAEPLGGRLASAGADGFLRMWDATTGTQLHQWKAHQTWVTKTLWMQNGIWSAGADGRLKRWSDTGQEQLNLEASAKAVTALMVQGDTVFTGSELGEVRAFDMHTGKERWRQQVKGTVMSIANMSGAIYVGQAKGVVSIWDMTNGRSRGTLRGDR